MLHKGAAGVKQMNSETYAASCLCGAVRFAVVGPLPAPVACHCFMCRKLSGHYEASLDVPRDRLLLTEVAQVRWYASSKKVRRGFCGTCGSTLFFDPIHHDWIGISMGAFDTTTDTRLSLHIFTADKGDYYDIADGLPQNLQ
mgnify:CR=1 FL=1